MPVEFGRQHSHSESFEQDFAIADRCLEVRWDPTECKFNDAIVQHWSTNLERTQHAGSINLYQDVFRQITFEVVSCRPLQKVDFGRNGLRSYGFCGQRPFVVTG